MHNSINLLKQSGSIRSLFFTLFIPVCVMLSVFPFTDMKAQGNLVIIPRRVVFEGNQKTQEITLANGGADSATYIISLVQFRMKDDGSFEHITVPDPGQNFADKYLRFYPRTVTLAPRESQMIKMQLVKSQKLEAGEYRSHIYFRAVPKSKPLGDKETQKDTTTFSASLTPVFGITIPVIIRIGESTGKVNLSDLSLIKVNDTTSKCKMTFNRTGNTSVYGDIVVNYTSPLGKVTQVAIVKGFAVYTPNSLRRFDCKLDNIAGVDYREGKLNIVYSTQVGTSTKPLKLAEAELILK
jgi:P pilus assembly chaperone PapD